MKIFHSKASTYSYDAETSSDSEDELIQRLQRSTSSQSNLKGRAGDSKVGAKRASTITTETVREKNSRPSSTTKKRSKQQLHNKYKALKLTNDVKREDPVESFAGSSSSATNANRDLISLAEKGRIGKVGSTDGSCSSEAGSADTEEDSLAPFLKSKAEQKTRADLSAEPISEFDNTGFEKCGSDTHSPEHSSQIQSDSPITRCGSLQVAYAYDAPTKKLIVSVIQAQDIPCKDRGGANQVYVRLLLLPHKKQRHKTKVKSSTGSPIFNESFTFTKIDPEDVMNLSVRFRVYGNERMRREHMIGESIVMFRCMKPQQQETRLWLSLEPRSNLAVSALF